MIYPDDILIYSKNEDDYFLHLKKIIKEILTYGFLLNTKKANSYVLKLSS